MLFCSHDYLDSGQAFIGQILSLYQGQFFCKMAFKGASLFVTYCVNPRSSGGRKIPFYEADIS